MVDRVLVEYLKHLIVRSPNKHHGIEVELGGSYRADGKSMF